MFRLIGWLFFLLVFLAGLVFTVYNPHPVTLHYVLGSVDIRLAILLLINLLLGVALGILVSGAWILQLRYQNRRLRKNQQQAAQEISQLQTKLSSHHGPA